MSFKELYTKAKEDRDEILEYQASRVEWLFDTLKVVEELPEMKAEKKHGGVVVMYIANDGWTFRIETGRWAGWDWYPHKLGKCHRVTVTNRWDDTIMPIEQSKEGGLPELRTFVQTWLAREIVKRKVDSAIDQYLSEGYCE